MNPLPHRNPLNLKPPPFSCRGAQFHLRRNNGPRSRVRDVRRIITRNIIGQNIRDLREESSATRNKENVNAKNILITTQKLERSEREARLKIRRLEQYICTLKMLREQIDNEAVRDGNVTQDDVANQPSETLPLEHDNELPKPQKTKSSSSGGVDKRSASP